MLLFSFHQISGDVILVPYQIFIQRKLWLSTLFLLILPIIYLAGRKDVRQFIQMTLKPMFLRNSVAKA